MLGIRISARDILCVRPLKAEGDDVFLFIAGTAGEGSRIIRVFPEEPADSGHCWRMTAGRRVTVGVTAFQKPVQETEVALLRFGLMVRHDGKYADAMIRVSQTADEVIQLVAKNGDKTLALLQYFGMNRREMEMLSAARAQHAGPSDYILLGSCNIQFTVSGNEWEDALFPLPKFEVTRTQTGRAVTLNYQFSYEEAEYGMTLIMESYPAQPASDAGTKAT
jgi:hypothetical protein